MAYTKTTWNNLSNPPINADNLNKIEQGIYDNSLGIDKINPSGTATTTAEIEEGQITDVIGFKSLKLKGQTSQYTTTGKNLLAIKQLTTQTINGVTFTPHYTGNKLDYVNANGTATATAGYILDNANIDQASTYTNELPSGTYILDDFSGSSSANTALFFRYSTDNSTHTTIDSADNSRKITIDSTFKFASYIRINNGATVNNMKFYPQLEIGSTQTTYEPYTNGASPNPDFPQDVNNVSGYNVIGISNKNIARLELEGKIRSYANGNQYTTSGFNGYIASVKPNTTYVSSCQDISTQYTEISNLCYFDDNMNFLSGNVYNGRNKTFTTPANCKYVSIAVNQTIINFQLEQNSSATSYTAHQGNNFEINLGKNLIEDTFKGYNINAQGKFETGGTSADFDVQIARVMQGVTYTITPSTNVIAYFNGKPTTSSTSYNGSREVITNTNTLTPTKSGYIAIRTATTDTAQLEKGAITTPYAPYFPPIELCKIGTYQDYIVKKDGKWWKHKEVGKVVWNGTESWASNPGITTTYVIARPSDLAYGNNNVLFNYFKIVDDLSTATEGARIGGSINLKNPNTEDLASFKTWLGTNNVEMYYQSTTPTDEEITYTPLIRQLDELYNSGLYDVTNISQDNSSEAFILDIEACKNNINGIVEYIRR